MKIPYGFLLVPEFVASPFKEAVYEVVHCNGAENKPEMKIRIQSKYFDEHLWSRKNDFILDNAGAHYIKTIAAEDLDVSDFTDSNCKLGEKLTNIHYCSGGKKLLRHKLLHFLNDNNCERFFEAKLSE